jgi:glucokinase
MLAGIDLGGTQVRVALARSDGQLIASFKTKTALLGSPEKVVEWAAAEIERHRGREKVRSIAIGAPGPIDIKRSVLVNPPNLHGWRDVPLAPLWGGRPLKTPIAPSSRASPRRERRGHGGPR